MADNYKLFGGKTEDGVLNVMAKTLSEAKKYAAEVGYPRVKLVDLSLTTKKTNERLGPRRTDRR